MVCVQIQLRLCSLHVFRTCIHRDVLLLSEYNEYAAFCKDMVLSRFRLPKKPCELAVHVPLVLCVQIACIHTFAG